MSKGIKKNEKSGRTIYSDIIDLPHHQSPTRPHMSLYDRAAQFAPFAALTGYEDMVDEEARITDTQKELGEFDLETLNRKLNLLSNLILDGDIPKVTITYFVADNKKEGGKYVTTEEEIKKIDTVNQRLILMRTKGNARTNVEIRIQDVTDIRGEIVDYQER